MIKEIAIYLMMLAATCIGIIISVDIILEIRNKINGTPRIRVFYEEQLKAKDETIDALRKTIASQEARLRMERSQQKRLAKMVEKLRGGCDEEFTRE